jgi:hypothetical protein
MRWTLLAVAVVFAGGCTHTFLERSTLRTASSLSDFQTRQVLDNLAQLACEPEANPWHLNLTSGVVQVTDQATGSVTGDVLSSGLSSNNVLIPAVSAQRILVEQWSVNPVTDGEQIETLQVAYRKALDPGGEKVDDEILKQIVSLSVRFSLLPGEDTVRRLFRKHEVREKAGEIVETLCLEIEDLQNSVSALGSYLAKAREKTPESAWGLEVQRHELVAKAELKRAELQTLLDLLDEGGPPSNSSPEDAPKPSVTGTAEKGKRARARPPARHLYRTKSPRTPLTPGNSSDTTLLILTALQVVSPAGYLPPTDIIWESARNPALVDQAEDQISQLEKLLEFRKPWVYRGGKGDVPKCACYVGHFKGCREDCYVWVMPDDFAMLEKFTRIVLSLAAPNAAQETPARSPAFSPGLR